MKKGRFLHVPADSLSHSHGDQQLFGSLLGFLFQAVASQSKYVEHSKS